MDINDNSVPKEKSIGKKGRDVGPQIEIPNTALELQATTIAGCVQTSATKRLVEGLLEEHINTIKNAEHKQQSTVDIEAVENLQKEIDKIDIHIELRKESIPMQTDAGIIGNLKKELEQLNKQKEEKTNQIEYLHENPSIKPENIDTGEFPQSEIELFFSNDHKSKLVENQSLLKDIEFTKNFHISQLDDTDTNDETAYAHISKNNEGEISAAESFLKNIDNIAEQTETAVGADIGGFLDTHNTTKEGTKKEIWEGLTKDLEGDKVSEKNKKLLEAVRPSIEKSQKIAELLQLEKARVIINALMSSEIERDAKETDAISLVGKRDFEFIKKQVEHMNQKLNDDWSKKEGGVMPHSSGRNLFSDNTLSKVNGEPNDAQQSALTTAYQAVANNKTSAIETKDEKLSKTIAFTLASMSVLEEGKNTHYQNAIKEMRGYQNGEIKGEDITTPEGKKFMTSLSEKANIIKGGIKNWKDNAVNWAKWSSGVAVKAWPGSLAAGFLVPAVQKQAEEAFSNKHQHGGHQPFVDQTKEDIGAGMRIS